MAGGGTQGWTGGWNETCGVSGEPRAAVGVLLVYRWFQQRKVTYTHATFEQIFLFFPVAHCLLEVKPVVDISSHFILFHRHR